jgi:hypothetical protein
MKSIQITPDSGLPVSKARGRGRPASAAMQRYLKQFLALKPELHQSFFVEGAKRIDLEFLRRPVKKAGAGIRIVEVQEDEIYGVAGVRCWRLSGPYDEEL